VIGRCNKYFDQVSDTWYDFNPFSFSSQTFLQVLFLDIMNLIVTDTFFLSIMDAAMLTYPGDESLILVGVIPRPADLEIARLLGWYRIPMRSAPKVVNVDYMAFYQTGAFGAKHRWRIEYFAEVKGNELTTRGELFRDQQQHPRANEEYYKIQLGSLQSIPEPIMADRWKRITFLYTTGELFRKAKTVSDLVVRSDERKILWRSLRERAMQNSLYSRGQDFETDFELDESILLMLGDFRKIAEQDEFEFD
jgi:hypothetical protein